MDDQDHMVVGRIVRPHGVRGDLLVEPYSETIRSIEAETEVFIGSPQNPYTVLSLRSHRTRMILRVEGCEDRETAEAFRGNEVLIPTQAAEPLPEGVYYRWQILGLAVVEQGGRHLGTVMDILETGANDVYVVQGDGPRELLLPAIESVILEVDLDAGSLLVLLPEGLE
ncbi:MAG: ribosome maturation factor RimM [Chloroflexi bacterium]|nr:ribosome maturation factor RimM [Chloroflexota bacterium]